MICQGLSLNIEMPVKPDKKSFSVTLPLETYELLKKWAGGKDWNVSQATRNIIAEVLGKEYGIDPESLRDTSSGDTDSIPSKKKA
jgi:hypothetical protein